MVKKSKNFTKKRNPAIKLNTDLPTRAGMARCWHNVVQGARKTATPRANLTERRVTECCWALDLKTKVERMKGVRFTRFQAHGCTSSKQNTGPGVHGVRTRGFVSAA